MRGFLLWLAIILLVYVTTSLVIGAIWVACSLFGWWLDYHEGDPSSESETSSPDSRL